MLHSEENVSSTDDVKKKKSRFLTELYRCIKIVTLLPAGNIHSIQLYKNGCKVCRLGSSEELVEQSKFVIRQKYRYFTTELSHLLTNTVLGDRSLLSRTYLFIGCMILSRLDCEGRDFM